MQKQIKKKNTHIRSPWCPNLLKCIHYLLVILSVGLLLSANHVYPNLVIFRSRLPEQFKNYFVDSDNFPVS